MVDPELEKLNKPWLVAVWPGMGHVSVLAGYYLLSKLNMHQIGEFAPRELFDLDHIEVDGGLIRPGRLPRSRLFGWHDPEGRHDLVVFLGEAQPPAGKYEFCQRLIGLAQEMDVERVFTFASMATQMHPQEESRVFAGTTDADGLGELKQLELELLNEGHISGLNGLLLGVALENGLRGTCLLGEIPHVLTQIPFPKASLAVLQVFTTIAGIELNLSELKAQADAMEQQLGEALSQLEEAMGGEIEEEYLSGVEPMGMDPTSVEPVSEPTAQLDEEDRQQIEELFAESERDRSRAYELKRELDKHGVFGEYEDRFLDLFRKNDE